MIRYDAIKELLKEISDEIVVVNIGHPAQELYSIKDRKRNFYMLGSMGLASSIGLGMAMVTENTVISIDGDGSILMNLGSLSTIGSVSPKNYILVIIDNKSYGSTGFQQTFTAKNVSLKNIALGSNIVNTIVIKDKKLIRNIFSNCLVENNGPYCLIIETDIGKPDQLSIIPYDPIYIKNKIMEDICQEC